MIAENMDHLYQILLDRLVHNPRFTTAPRGLKTFENLNTKLVLEDPYQCVITIPIRNLNYRFMLAEMLWIIDGRDDVASIAHYNSKIAQFSDDGKTFYGAYGPRFASQLTHIWKTLTFDRDSRQAVMTLWIQNPEPSKDIPCTISIQFLIRYGKLFCTVNMRSSDAYLGIPYDVFNFATVQELVRCGLKHHYPTLKMGQLTLNLASSHLYERDRDAAIQVLNEPITPELSRQAPLILPSFATTMHLKDYYESVLKNAQSSKNCLAILRESRQSFTGH